MERSLPLCVPRRASGDEWIPAFLSFTSLRLALSRGKVYFVWRAEHNPQQGRAGLYYRVMIHCTYMSTMADIVKQIITDINSKLNKEYQSNNQNVINQHILCLFIHSMHHLYSWWQSKNVSNFLSL